MICNECGNDVPGRTYPCCATCMEFLSNPLKDDIAMRATAYRLGVCLKWCAWCKSYLGWRPGEGISHGICPDCATDMMPLNNTSQK